MHWPTLVLRLTFVRHNLCILLKFVELKPEFTRQLSEIKAKDYETVTFVCELNDDNLKPIWKKGDQQLRLTADKKYLMLTDNKIQKLIIRDVTEEDSGEYSCNYRNVSTMAKLVVGGECVKMKKNKTNIVDCLKMWTVIKFLLSLCLSTCFFCLSALILYKQRL